MRFIRKGGRVIPIADGAAPEKKYSSSYGKSAALGVAGGVVGGTAALARHLGMAAKNSKAVKFGIIGGAVSTGMAIGGIGFAVKKSFEAKDKDSPRSFQATKHFLAGAAGRIAGYTAVGTFAGIKIAKGIAKRRIA